MSPAETEAQGVMIAAFAAALNAVTAYQKAGGGRQYDFDILDIDGMVKHHQARLVANGLSDLDQSITEALWTRRDALMARPVTAEFLIEALKAVKP